MKIESDKDTFAPANAATQVHTGAGRILSILVTANSATPQTISIYDNTSAVTLLMTIFVNINAPVIVHFPDQRAVKFSTGLHVVTPAAASIFFVLLV